MTPEAKKKLEEMAIEYALGEVDTCHRVDYMAGAQAAWDLAVLAERERCAQRIHDEAEWLYKQGFLGLVRKLFALKKVILNPPAEPEGK